MNETSSNIKRPEYIFGIVLLFGLLIFLGILYITKNQHKEVDSLQVDDCNVKCNMQVSEDDTCFYVNGWCLIPGESIQEVDVTLLLWNEDAHIGYYFPVMFNKRQDVTEAFNDGKNYDYSGFTATIEKSELKNKKYEIILLYKNDGHDFTVKTGNMIGE